MAFRPYCVFSEANVTLEVTMIGLTIAIICGVLLFQKCTRQAGEAELCRI